ncbi:MAG TPA: hypothetical protein VF708_11905 [Pyrinomonadaceae bacterium]|jgi:hypothetical protein
MIRSLKVLVVLALTLAALAGAASRAQEEERRFIDLKQVPVEGAAAQDFVPRGWKIEEQVDGDLNADARPDTVLKLIEDLPEETAEGALNIRYRALLVLLKTETGKLHRAAVGARLLQCTGCGGVLGSPGGGDIQIEKGVLVVYQLSGSRESTDVTQRFRYDARLKRFVLIGEDQVSTDRLTGESTSESTNYLTGVKIIKKTRLDKSGDRDIPVSTATKKIAVTKRFLEDIDYERQ